MTIRNFHEQFRAKYLMNQLTIYEGKVWEIWSYLHTLLGLHTTLFIMYIIQVIIGIFGGLTTVDGMMQVSLDLLLLDIWQARLSHARQDTQTQIRPEIMMQHNASYMMTVSVVWIMMRQICIIWSLIHCINHSDPNINQYKYTQNIN